MRWLPVACALLLAGCLAPPEPGPPSPASNTTPTADRNLSLEPRPPIPGGLPSRLTVGACDRGCFEPVVAVDPEGRIFVTSGDTTLFVSEDGGASFEALAAPPLPEGAGEGRTSDELVQVGPDGRLYWSAMVIPTLVPLTDAGGPMGFQVAVSPDGGRSWPTNVYLSATATRETPVANGDRQWLAFGEPGEVFLTWQSPGMGVFLTASGDGGATWGPVRPVALPDHSNRFLAGPGLVSGGRLHVPFLTFGGARGADAALRIASTEDRGETFRYADAYRASPVTTAGYFFPVLVEDADGRLHVAWRDGEATIRVASSPDGGGAWDESNAWSEPGVAAVSPWMALLGETLVLAWHEGRSVGVSDLVVASGTAEGPTGAVVRAPSIRGRDDRPANTDFTHLAAGPDGTLLVVWSDQRANAVYLERIG